MYPLPTHLMFAAFSLRPTSSLLSVFRRAAVARFSSAEHIGVGAAVALQLEDVCKYEYGRNVFTNANLKLPANMKVAVLGSLSSDKSTLLQLLAGVEREFDGTCTVEGSQTVGFLSSPRYATEENLGIASEKSVRDVLLSLATEHVALLANYQENTAKFALPEYDNNPSRLRALMEEQTRIQTEIEDKRCWDLETRLNVITSNLRVRDLNRAYHELSEEEQRRVMLARVLLIEPPVLILDDPVFHLEPHSRAWLIRFIRQYNGLVVFSTQDVAMLEETASGLVEIRQGRCFFFRGSYTLWLSNQVSSSDLGKRMEEWKRLRARHHTAKAKLSKQPTSRNKKGSRAQARAQARTQKSRLPRAKGRQKIGKRSAHNSPVGARTRFPSFEAWDRGHQAELNAIRDARLSEVEGGEWAKFLEDEARRVKQARDQSERMKTEARKERQQRQQKMRDKTSKDHAHAQNKAQKKAQARRAYRRRDEKTRQNSANDGRQSHDRSQKAQHHDGYDKKNQSRSSSSAQGTRAAARRSRWPETTKECLEELGLKLKKDQPSDEIVKGAFRKLALSHHPDRGGDEHTFQKINHAYQVLVKSRASN